MWFPELRAKIGSRLDSSLQNCLEAIVASVQDYLFIELTGTRSAFWSSSNFGRRIVNKSSEFNHHYPPT
ncbi:hypothetical protein BWK47_04355 [Synechocystis sp. CACIAM 05]|nr:hypothetical protein BWK47_04355 [Synechocystis sp. CACIAM 05]